MIQAAKQRLEKRQKEADDEKGREPGDDKSGSGKPGKPYKRPYGVPEEKAQDNSGGVSAEYRFHHIPNANTRNPNAGINSNLLITRTTIYF